MEIFDICDEKGLPTGDMVSREEAHARGIRHRTAHVWIVREVQGRYQVLLQRRSMNKDSFPGQLDTSSAGHIPAGQEPNRALPAVFRRNPGFHSLRHLSARLYNNTAGEDLSFVSAQIIYEYRGRQR